MHTQEKAIVWCDCHNQANNQGMLAPFVCFSHVTSHPETNRLTVIIILETLFQACAESCSEKEL